MGRILRDLVTKVVQVQSLPSTTGDVAELADALDKKLAPGFSLLSKASQWRAVSLSVASFDYGSNVKTYPDDNVLSLILKAVWVGSECSGYFRTKSVCRKASGASVLPPLYHGGEAWVL